jgi:hypothetical protein
MCENLFSNTFVAQAREFATANNHRAKTSLPHRHRLKVVLGGAIDKK